MTQFPTSSPTRALSLVMPEGTVTEIPLDAAIRVAERVAATEFVPTGLRNRPDAVVAAILRGAEIGVPPMQALSSISIINGRPTLSAELMRALIRRRGHTIVPQEEPTETRCTIYGRRADDNSEDRVTWTLDMARKAGLAGKQPWQQYPRQMLVARATAELARRHFPDVIGGLLAEEEAADIDGAAPPAPAPQNGALPAPPKRTRRLSRAEPAPPPEEEATPDVIDAQARPAAPTDDLLGDEVGNHAQAIAMQAREAGVERADVIAIATGGRKRSARALTDAESRDVLDIIRRLRLGELRLENEEAGGVRLVEVEDTPIPADEAEAEVIAEEETVDRESVAREVTDLLSSLGRDRRLELVRERGWQSGEALPQLLARLDDAALVGMRDTARFMLEGEA